MDQQESELIDLEFFPKDGIFWPERRALIVPLPDSSRFLALGVMETQETVVKVEFVARGRVKEDLGAFIDRMGQEATRVELPRKLPPDLKAVAKEYGFADDFESTNAEDPPPPGSQSSTPQPPALNS
jgi:hypothetical protein